ncbi:MULTISPECIES: response regulator [Thalassospira]|uniref:Histidine kinase n=2 Tax=Thalassospira TaxID=168934 RepID=A0A367WA77_9PROT|nr:MULTISPECIES: response regulator [Thalassospira]MDG4719915.1 response regulator [Thalassospira sp. FZY0004]RCK38356.1 histidine kinase [Thalassospira profundimaris]
MENRIIEALAQTQVGVALFDADERIVFANPAWEQLITGVAEEDLIFNETQLSDGGMISICFVKPQLLPFDKADFSNSANDAKIGTIIIADDSESNRMVARRILQSEGYSVVEASNGQTVLNMLRRGVDADLILMDVEMPDMDGLHTTRRIRHMPGPVSQTPIIALSAHQSRDWNIIARQSGVDEFINKPIQREKLVQTMKDLIARGSVASLSSKPKHVPPPHLRSKSARLGRPPRPESPTSPVLDIRVLEQLYNDAGDEGARCGIDIFINETETRLVKIDKALSEDDLKTVRNEVHALKSTSGTFGLRQLSELCETTQSIFEDGEFDEDHVLSLSRQVVQLAPTALTALNLYRRSRNFSSNSPV